MCAVYLTISVQHNWFKAQQYNIFNHYLYRLIGSMPSSAIYFTIYLYKLTGSKPSSKIYLAIYLYSLTCSEPGSQYNIFNHYLYRLKAQNWFKAQQYNLPNDYIYWLTGSRPCSTVYLTIIICTGLLVQRTAVLYI